MTIPEPASTACRAPASRQPGAGPPGGETYRAVDQHLERDEDRSRDGELQWYAAEWNSPLYRSATAALFCPGWAPPPQPQTEYPYDTRTPGVRGTSDYPARQPGSQQRPVPKVTHQPNRIRQPRQTGENIEAKPQKTANFVLLHALRGRS
jgi:hypothetical protein